MSRIGHSGRRIVYGFVFAAAPTICSVKATEPIGAAKISAPVVTGIRDPFANVGSSSGANSNSAVEPIPTPIMTSSGTVAEASAAVKPLGTVMPPSAVELRGIAPQASRDAESTKVIDAGKLVPLATPSATSDVKPQAIREPTSEDKLTEVAPSGLKPIQPAPAITRETVAAPAQATSTKAKPVAAKKSSPKPKPAETPSERVGPAVNFSFPQPVIPLESALRKFFKWSASRR